MLSRLTETARRRQVVKNALAAPELKLNIGAGGTPQEGYLSVDVRPLKGVDFVGTPRDCLTVFAGRCDEIYASHVLEHFGQPGKALRDHDDSVLGFLKIMFELLKPGGFVRLAVPDFAALAKLYIDGTLPLYPRLLGRLCGEQNYVENLHKCMFDHPFLEECLTRTGFVKIQEWDPHELQMRRDSSFDELEGVRTSLNLLAEKPAA